MFWSFLILVAVFAIAYFVWRIVDMLPDFIFRLSEIQRDLAEIRRQLADVSIEADAIDDEPAPAVTSSSRPTPILNDDASPADASSAASAEEDDKV